MDGSNQKVLHTMRKNSAQLFEKVEIQKPSEIVIQQIKQLISSGELHPGDYLPPERELAELLGVGRGHVREALKQLQFFGILEIRPQHGTVVADLGIKVFDNLISSVLRLEKKDFLALMETRSLLEVHVTRLAALRASDAEIEELVQIHEIFRQEAAKGISALEQDMAFHVKIADCSKNSVLTSLIRLIVPDIVKLSQELNTCSKGRSLVVVEEHTAILRAIQQRDPDLAAKAMTKHMEPMEEMGTEAMEKHYGSSTIM